MTSKRWQDVERIYHAALAHSAADRAAFVRDACAGDKALRADIESLLAQEGASVFLETPPSAAAESVLGSLSASLVGRQLGPYQITAVLGAGGMGQVYRARDTKLGRDVAIKVLPSMFTADRERLGRFEREARVLAAMNHSHIGAIYGLETVDGVPALVLELVEGPTLGERIARGPLPVREAQMLATQIAEALEAAHERGIVHRDLKPDNIKVTASGHVKVLDFGLAKAAVGDTPRPDLTHSPTISIGRTGDGVILGTAAYMSPEQARGQVVDKRADIWAFGCVLYEMLTGRVAFPGATVTDTLAAIIDREPDWRALPAATPQVVTRLLHRCLDKNPKRRLHDIADARIEIEDALAAPTDSQDAFPSAAVRHWPTRGAWAALSVGIAAAAAGVMGFRTLRGTPADDPHVVRFTVAAPLNTVISSVKFAAVSPDGRRLALIAGRGDTAQLWVRALDELDAQPLRGTEGANDPFWAPDNQTVAFYAEGKLKAVVADGGSVRTLCDAPDFQGGSWSPGGDAIVFATLMHGLFSVPARGGSATLLPNPGAASAEARLFPSILPDGRHFVYVSSPSNVAWVASLDGKEPPVRLLNIDSEVQYVAPGFLMFVRRGTLIAQRFDVQHRTLIGEVLPIVEGMQLGTQTYEKAFATSSNGVLVYRTGLLNVATQLTLSDRAGRRLDIVGKPGPYRNPELSPDGAYVAMEAVDPQNGSADIWRLELERGGMTRVTRDPGDEVQPVWSPDGVWIVFGSNRDGGVRQLYRVHADGTGGEERLFQSAATMLPQAYAPDGKFLVYQSRPGFKLGVLPFSIGSMPRLLDDLDVVQGAAQVSPDGHWLAYESREKDGNMWDVYLQSFPNRGLGPWRVSTSWGANPRWSRDGREIFYHARDGRLMTVAVTSTGPTLKFGSPAALFEASLLGGPMPVIPFRQQYDVTKDGRFLLNVPVEAVPEKTFTVVVNWTAAMKQ